MIKSNPQDRIMMINLWQIPYLEKGSLAPCCFLTLWDVADGKLNCMLVPRSGDIGLGVPFNTTQYTVLVHLLAGVTDLKPGLLTHVINNTHIYENHIDGLNVQLSKSNDVYEAPKLWINSEIKDFYDFTSADIKLIDYKHHEKISMEVAT